MYHGLAAADATLCINMGQADIPVGCDTPPGVRPSPVTTTPFRARADSPAPARREGILEAARAAIEEHGPVHRLARSPNVLGLARPNVYRHFGPFRNVVSRCRQRGGDGVVGRLGSRPGLGALRRERPALRLTAVRGKLPN
jgi:hypothetical protein